VGLGDYPCCFSAFVLGGDAVTEPLQPFDHNRSSYERPNQKWVCGWTDQGTPCRVGPDQCGKCRTDAQCKPVKRGDRWSCTRPASAGGSCSEGPSPDGACAHPVDRCHPVRSLRAKRGLFVLTMCSLVLGILVLLIFGPGWRMFITAGPLTAAHSTMEAAMGQSCEKCHSIAQASPMGWLMGDVETAHSFSQSELCLKCHGQLGSNAMWPHSMAPVDRFEDSTPGAAEGSIVPTAQSSQIACAICHREHHGRTFDLTEMDNYRCQACHAQRISSFAKDHPEFDASDDPQTTRINFNHNSQRHLTVSCNTCHNVDTNGQHMRLKGFDVSCSTCHGPEPTRVLHLPGLDFDAIEELEIPIGLWPQIATEDPDDGMLSSMMMLLLSADSETAEALEILSPSFDFLDDLDEDDEDQLDAVTQVIWAIKGLFYDLLTTTDPQGVFRTRLASISGQALDPAQIEALMTTLPDQSTLAAFKPWFNRFVEDVPQYRQDEELGARYTTDTPSASTEVDGKVKWKFDTKNFAITYQPTHHGDQLLQSVLNAAADQGTDLITEAYRGFAVASMPDKAGNTCTDCHRVDPSKGFDAGLSQEHRRSGVASIGGFSKFSHWPHLTMLGGVDKDSRQGTESLEGAGICNRCHHPEDSRQAASAGNQALTSGGFVLRREDCAQCHTPHAAGDSCLKCHNYHVRQLTTDLLATDNPKP